MRTGLFGGLLILCAFSAGTFAQDGQKVHGYLVDAICAKNHAKEAGYGANHTKKCSLMDVCARSGFSLITDDQKVFQFDAKGNEEALNLLKLTERDKDWKVVVTGKLEGQTIAVTSIALE